MAYMNQEKKAKIAVNLKNVMPKDWKFSLAVRHHSTIVCTIKSAPVNLLEMNGNREKLYVHHTETAERFGELTQTLKAINSALHTDNHDNSDLMTDYFDVGHYVDLQIGAWDKPFNLAA